MGKEYTVGFLFRNSAEDVALITKARPAWQTGKLNGPGGGIEIGENPLQAMRREFREEAGADVPEWRKFCELRHQDRTIHYYVAHGDYALTSMTDEIVAWYKVKDIPELPIVSNLLWLIPLSLDKDNVTAVVIDRSEPAVCLCKGFYRHLNCPMHKLQEAGSC